MSLTTNNPIYPNYPINLTSLIITYLTPFQLYPFFKENKIPLTTSFRYDASNWTINFTDRTGPISFYSSSPSSSPTPIMWPDEFAAIFSNFPCAIITGLGIITNYIPPNIFQRLHIRYPQKLIHLKIYGFSQYVLYHEDLPFPPSLKTLIISNCHLSDPPTQIEQLFNLRTLDISSCTGSTELNFKNCKKLRNLKLPTLEFFKFHKILDPDDMRIQYFTNLTQKVRKLDVHPPIIPHHLILYPHLHHIHLRNLKFQSLSILHKSLQSIIFTACSIEDLDISSNLMHIAFYNCNKLSNLEFLQSCTNLKSITTELCFNLKIDAKVFDACTNLTKVKFVTAHSIRNMQMWKNNIILTELEINQNIDDQPFDYPINMFPNLETLKLNNLSSKFSNLCQLIVLYQKNLKILKLVMSDINFDINYLIKECSKLEEIDLTYVTIIITSPVPTHDLNLSLKRFRLDECIVKNLDFLCGLSTLEHVEIIECDSLQHIRLKGCNALQNVIIDDCDNLTRINDINSTNIVITSCDITCFEKLGGANTRTLTIHDCPKIEYFTLAPTCTMLRTCDISECNNLRDVQGLEQNSHIQHIAIHECRNLVNISGLKKSKGLETFELKECDKIKSIDPLDDCWNLQRLHVSACRNLKWSAILDQDITSTRISQCPNIRKKTSCHVMTKLECIITNMYSVKRMYRVGSLCVILVTLIMIIFIIRFK